MTHEAEITTENIFVVSQKATTACTNVLSALQVLSRDNSTRDALSRMHRLGAYTRKIQSELETGRSLIAIDLPDKIVVEWANALILMDALTAETENILANPMVLTAAELQKSGKTA